MIRPIFLLLAALLSMPPVAHAEDGQAFLLDLDFRQQQMHSADRELTHPEYQRIYSRNQRYLRRTLKSYTEQALGRMGISGRPVELMGAAVGVMTSGGARLNLNQSKTLAIEIQDLDSQEPGLYFGFDFKW